MKYLELNNFKKNINWEVKCLGGGLYGVCECYIIWCNLE